MKREILHVDVNNAFLSWTAIDMLKKGSKIDIREMGVKKLIHIRVKEILKEKKRSKYWFIKNMERRISSP